MGRYAPPLAIGPSINGVSIILCACIVAVAAGGIALIARGVRFPRPSHRPLLIEKAQRLLVAWRRAPGGGLSSTLTDVVAAALATVERPATIAMGVGCVTVAGVAALVACATSSLSWGGDLRGILSFGAATMIALASSAAVGHLCAVWRLRRVTVGRIAYGDVRGRRLADYRARVLLLAPFTAIAATVAATLGRTSRPRRLS